MKAKAISFTATLALIAVLVLAGCGGGTTTTSQPPASTSSQPPATTTSKPPATTTTPPVTTSQATVPTTSTAKPTTTTAAGGKELPTTANPVTNVNHNTQAKLDALKGLCLMMCHGPGTPNQVPLPPTWDGTKNGSESHPGVWTVVPGSPQDHTGRTDDQCTSQAGCHTLPGAAPATTAAATTKPATTAPAGTTAPAATGTVMSGKVTIDVTAGGFGYKKVTIAVGTRVIWDNPDHEDHAVVSDSTGVDSFEIGGGATVESDFNKAGSYSLHLEENKAITITITVV